VSEQETKVRKEPRPGPASPTELGKRSWWAVLKRTAKQFSDDNLSDWAAALTYYGIMSLFPALLAAVSLLGLFGQGTSDAVINNLLQLTPGSAKEMITNIMNSLHAEKAASIGAIVGVALALWSASAYIGAFMRAANAIYDVPEGRPFWKTLPLRLGLTIITGVLLGVSVLAIVFTGGLAKAVGRFLHIGSTAVTVWDIAKWPVLLIAISLVIAILYYLSPNAKHTGFRWITPGSLLAVLLWIAASGAFAVYIGNFSSYNKTYGTFGGILAFLLWIWISNVVILLGAEFDAEMERGRAIAGGMDADQEPYMPLKDDRKVDADTEGEGLK
jgi:membrane protein